MGPCGPINTPTCFESWTWEGRRHAMVGSLITWIENLVTGFTRWWPEGTFFSFEVKVYSALSVFLVALICGAVGSLVVANRTAFFSDALAQCSFAGAAFGL